MHDAQPSIVCCFDRPVPGTCFGLKLCGACCELLSCSVFYRNNHCSYNATCCTVTMITTGLVISLAIGTPLRPNAARALRVQLFALVTCAIIDAEDRARDATQYRGTPGGHTLPVITYSVSSIRLASRSRRAATSRNEIRSALAQTHRAYRASRSRRPATSPNERSLETHQRTARRRQRPWLHDRAALAPVRGLRGERLA